MTPPAAVARRSFHPLELIPVFARWRPGFWRDVVYTFIFNAIVACGFTALNLVFDGNLTLRQVFWPCLVYAQCIGYTIWGMMAVLHAVAPAAFRTAGARWVVFVAVPLAGAFVGYWIAAGLMGATQAQAALFTLRGAASVLTVAAIVTLILVAIFLPRDRAAQAEARAARDEARVAAAERETTLARMQLLQAQVEPHFLYNTLAHVMSLVDAEPALAKRMLHRLIDLLRATAVTSAQPSTIQSQVTLLQAYLDIVAIRMASRLAWSIEVDAGLADVRVPPMLLQPVVENAIKHGLEPRIEGGRVDVRVARRGGRIVLTVADTGLGVPATRDPASTGVGLPNLRARLAALFGNDATVRLADNVPHGTIVTIEIPEGSAA